MSQRVLAVPTVLLGCLLATAPAWGTVTPTPIDCSAKDPYPSTLVDSSGLTTTKFGKIRFKARDGNTLNAYTYRATTFNPATSPILFVMHGTNRNAEDYLHNLAAVAEMATPYYARQHGSLSKLSTWRDGARIACTIVDLYRSERPLAFFFGLGTALAVVSICLAVPVFATYLEEGVVPRIPTAILSTGLMLLASLSIVAGLVLDTVTRGRREMKLIAYLAQPVPGDDVDRRV